MCVSRAACAHVPCAHAAKLLKQHSNVERAQCVASTRGSRPMKRWERIKKKKVGAWREEVGEMFSGSVTEREIWYTHPNRRTLKERSRGRERERKKTGHIPQAPENVLVIFGRLLLIDEWGVFKPLPLWSGFNSDCTWQATECAGTFVILRSHIEWYLTTAWHQKVHRRKDELPLVCLRDPLGSESDLL